MTAELLNDSWNNIPCSIIIIQHQIWHKYKGLRLIQTICACLNRTRIPSLCYLQWPVKACCFTVLVIIIRTDAEYSKFDVLFLQDYNSKPTESGPSSIAVIGGSDSTSRRLPIQDTSAPLGIPTIGGSKPDQQVIAIYSNISKLHILFCHNIES